MTAATEREGLVTFLPCLRADDACANYWMRQVTVRLRREVCWCWHERGGAGEVSGALPPFADRVSAALDMSRFWIEKQTFFQTDVTARYLSEQLQARPPSSEEDQTVRGSFAWVVEALGLDEVSSFVLALALTTAFDASIGSVIGACLNNPSEAHANLALAQKLWDQPERVLRIADPFHPLFRFGLLTYAGRDANHYSEIHWEAPLTVPPLVVTQLLFPRLPFPDGLALIAGESPDSPPTESARVVALRLSSANIEGLKVVPVLGPKGSPRRDTVHQIAKLNHKSAVQLNAGTTLLEDKGYLNSIATLCWLRDAYLFVDNAAASQNSADKHRPGFALPSTSIEATLFVSVNDRSQLGQIPSRRLLPTVIVEPLLYEERMAYLKRTLGPKAEGLDGAIAECSRRFRYEKETLSAICAELAQIVGQITEADLVAACRAELDTDIGELASRVTPRFDREELVLPRKQHLQFQEHIKAMRSLTEVHYGWGTAKVWNESGISVLFAGPPGTGKTMAAEILAERLDLPMYRIDLSQVVNKYIGETEKNLKRVFDAADVSDMILFFDEADSLFGRRTEVSDAHDRYANLEISYLLERMERFKGLAILATNRKKDLDEAFLRRLRYIIDFPLPGLQERRRIWQQVIPPHADASELDFDFLAKQFQLAGGNIRSIVFNACLQCAGDSSAARVDNSRSIDERPSPLTMEQIIIAIKREYDKLNRSQGLEQFGPYAPIVANLD